MRGARWGIGIVAAIICLLAATASVGAAVGAAEPVAATPIATRLVSGPALEIEQLKFDKGHGTATLLAKVSGPGRLYLYGRNVMRDSVHSSGAGIAKLKVAAKGVALKSLRATGKVTLKMQLKFVTSEGGVANKSRAVTLHLHR